jgi:Transposase DDE domain
MQLPNKCHPKGAKGSLYKIRNWKEYNQALKQRGSLEIWIEEDIESKWYYQGESQRGAQYEYSDVCIEMAAMLRAIYHLPYRQLEGFIKSLALRAGWGVKVPDYTVIHRRIKQLGISVPDSVKEGKGKIYVVIDSTGLKVYGEGEWKVRQHGWGKHRTWMKLHVAVDEATAIIESCQLTTNAVDDAAMVAPLLNEVKAGVKKMAGDGAYDKTKVYEVLKEKKIRPVIPPRRGARIKKHGNKRGKPLARDKNIRAIRKLGRKRWKEKNNYHRRSLAETSMFRFKVILAEH